MNKTIINMIENGDSSLVAVNGENIYKGDGIGVKPIISPMRNNIEFFKGYEVADTIIGKAAALLLTLSGAKAVYGKIMSRAAVDILKENGIDYQYGVLVDFIKNRSGTGLCPLEDAVKTENNPQIALSKIEKKIEQLMYGVIAI